MKQLREKKLRQYPYRVYGLFAYMNVWVWVMALALAGLMALKATYWAAFLTPICIVSVLVICACVFAGALVRPCDKTAFLFNTVFLVVYTVWGAADLVLTLLAVFLAVQPGGTGLTAAVLQRAAETGVSPRVVAMARTLPLTVLMVVALLAACVMLRNFIKHRYFFLYTLPQLRAMQEETLRRLVQEG